MFLLPAMMGMPVWYGTVRALGQHVLNGQEPPPAKAVATIAAIMVEAHRFGCFPRERTAGRRA